MKNDDDISETGDNPDDIASDISTGNAPDIADITDTNDTIISSVTTVCDTGIH